MSLYQLTGLLLAGMLLLGNCSSNATRNGDSSNRQTNGNQPMKVPEKEDRKATGRTLMKSFSDEQKTAFNTTSLSMVKRTTTIISSTKSDQEKAKAVQELFAAEMKTLAAISQPTDAKMLLQHTFAAVEHGFDISVAETARKVSNINEVKSRIRESIASLRTVVEQWPADQTEQEVAYETVEPLADDSYEVVDKNEMMTKEAIVALIAELETLYAQLTSEQQSASLELQDAMNKQAQLMQMMSNLVKMMHDTAMAIIRNMK
jgi:hypothetical protein